MTSTDATASEASASRKPLFPAATDTPLCVRTLHIVAYLCALVLMVLGITVVVGWLIHSEPLMSVVPGRVTMKINTATCFFLAGLALVLAMRQSPAGRRVAKLLAILVAAVGVLSSAEYLFSLDFGIDQLLMHDPMQIRFPGRMAPHTAVNFTFTGVALFLLQGSRLWRNVAQVLALLLGATAFTSIVGYLYGVSVLYGSASYTSMALHTGVGFLILAVGLLFFDPTSPFAQILCSRETGGWLVRRGLPAVILIPVALGGFYLRGPLAFLGMRFGLAIFAVSLAATGAAALWLVALYLNNSERQRAETERVREQGAAALRQSEHELRLVTDQLPTLISYLDSEGRFLRVNRTYELWTGLPSSEIVGRTVRDLLGDAYDERSAPARAAALQGQTITFETQYPTLRGERQAQVTYAPDIDDSGHVRGLACMVLDVDDHRRAEAALRQSEKLAVVGRLASSIAHEINNPLESVTNLLYLAAQDVAQECPPGSPLAEYVTLAQQELARVSQIVIQTLRFHRQPTHPTPCLISALIEQVLGLYHGRLVQARIEVEQRFRSKEPVCCREGEIRQVIANLVGNASEAMSFGEKSLAAEAGGRLLVRTRAATHPAPGVILTIADTGHGIAPETRKRLFEPFHTTKGATGSGLGLWVSKEIIDRNGGHMRLRSRVHHGTVFTIFLPHATNE